MNGYDIKYKSPAGNIGKHYHVRASSAEEASILSQIQLTYGTSYKPEEFQILEIIEVEGEQSVDRICN